MAFRKHTGVESTEVLSPKSHKLISQVMSKLGKKSVEELTDEEKASLLRRANQ